MKTKLILLWQKIKSHPKISIPVALAIVLAVGALIYFHPFSFFKTTRDLTVAKKTATKPTTKASPLTGLQVAPELADRPITAIVIENLYPDARPQSGLGQAGVVYEALAEGGITRFLAFFLDTQPASLGPVRSLRTYFVDWGLEFNAPVAHCGGNIDALDLIGPLGLKDMNQFAYGSSFYRTNDRYAPHNLYTSTQLLDKLEQVLGFNQPANFTVSPRKKDSPANPPNASTINIDYSYPAYAVIYKYNAATNDYIRYLGGVPHVDRNTGQPIHVKNVVVEYMPTSYGYTRIGQAAVVMGTVGSGKSIVFRDGTAVEGTWSKTSHNARTRLLDVAGQDISLNAGNTWYSIVPIGKLATYQ